MKSARIQLIENTTERVSRILAGNYGIQVIFHGDLCCTDGKSIYLPVIGPDAPEDFLSAVPGLIDHESSHIIHSDFEVIKDLSKIPNSHKLFALTNICEDARIEAAMIKKWRGCRVNFENTATWACKKLLKDWVKISEWGRLAQMCASVAMTGEDFWFTKYIAREEPKLWKHVNKVIPLLRTAKDQPDSQASLALAKQILDKLHDVTDSSSQEENASKQSVDCNEHGELAENAPLDHPECLDREYEPTDRQKKDDAAIANRQQMVQYEAKKYQQQSRGSYMVYSTKRDVIEPITKGDHQIARRLLQESRQITNVIRTRLMRNLLAKTNSHREPGKERGRIDRRALFRVSLDTSKKVFWQRSEAPSFNTRVSLWVDHSGSMAGHKLHLAALSALLFGEVLNSLKIPFEVCGFSTSTTQHDGQNIYDTASEKDKQTFTRWGGLWVGVYKSFEEQWQIVKHRCTNMESNQHDNTYDGESLRIAAQRLLEYPEPRRILFWFNDGEPCPNVMSFLDAHVNYLHNVAKEVEKVIEVFAIGIRTNNVKIYFKNAITINNIQDLPKVMLGELDRMLRKNQQAYVGASL